MIHDLIFLFLDTPLKVWGFLVFGGMGALMGRLIWFVSKDHLDHLEAEQESLRDQIESVKKKVAERDRMKRESTWKKEPGESSFLAGLKGLIPWLGGGAEQLESPLEESAKPEGAGETGRREEEVTGASAAAETEDDLTLLDGIDQAAAERLRTAGVKTFAQLGELESMSPEERARFAEAFELPMIPLERWRWAWTGGARESGEVRGEPVEVEVEVEVEPEPVPPAGGDDLTRVRGIDSQLAAAMNREGIFTYRQIADWTPSDVREISDRLDLADRVMTQRWIAQAAELAREGAGERFAFPPDAEAERAGGTEELEERYRRRYAGEMGSCLDEVLGVLYEGKPQLTDDLTRIEGIDRALEEDLNGLGIYRYKQIQDWSEEQVRRVEQRLELPEGRVEEQEWVDQAARLHREIYELDTGWEKEEPSPEALEQRMHRSFAGEPVSVDPEIGIVYHTHPLIVDELQRIEGVEPEMEQGLHELGVFRFKQISGWAPGHVRGIAKRLGCFPDRIYRERWIPQARDLAREARDLSGWLMSDAEPEEAPAEPAEEEVTVVYRPVNQFAILQGRFAGESQARVDPRLGIVYVSPPAVRDDLTQIEGIDGALEAELQAQGIYRFKQIAAWTDENATEVARVLRVEKRKIRDEDWVGEASRLVADEPVSAVMAEPEWKGAARIARETGAGYNEQFGYLYPQRPARADDLRAIRGVDDRLAALLNHQGIYRFWQIQHWTDGQRDQFSQRLGLGQAVVEQRWKEQCRRLALLSEAQHAATCPAPEEVDQLAAVADEFAGEPGVRVDLTLGIVYDQRPAMEDPLGMIQGLEPRHAQVLNSLGIFKFKQLANWSDGNVTAIASRLGLPKDSLERGKWVAQAIDRERSFYAASPRWVVDRPSLADYQGLIPELFPGEKVRADEELGIICTGVPARVDVLQGIRGIDPGIEGRLNAAGVWSFRQVASWSAANVEAFARLLRIPRDRIYLQRWIGQAQVAASRVPTQADAGTATAAPAAAASAPATGTAADYFGIFQREFSGESGVRVDRLLGIVYDLPPAEPDELTLIEGLDEGREAVLNRLGIFRFQQVAHWTSATVREVANRLQVDPGALERAGWPAQAARLQEDIYRASPAWAVARPALADYEAKIASDFSGVPVFADEAMGILYRGRPAVQDSLQRVQGITQELERQLNAAGVYRFGQIALWSEANVESYERFLGCARGRIYRQCWIRQAEALAAESAAGDEPATETAVPGSADQDRRAEQVEALERLFAGEAAARVDPRYGIVLGQAPEVVDDLSMLRGVSPQWQTLLNQLGIFRFKQIAFWSEANLEQVAAFLGIDAERIRQEDWRGQAVRLHNEIYSASPVWSTARPRIEEYQREIDEDFPGERVRPDQDLGIIYVGEPSRRDDLTRIQGLDAGLARRLNVSGVYRFKQISRWSEANVDGFARWLGCSPERIYRERWIPQSAILAAGDTEETVREAAAEAPSSAHAGDPTVHWDRELGYLYQEKPGQRDDLKQIRGIDGALEERLAGYGIYRFWQIAEWTPDQVGAFAARLQRGDLIEREDWVRQAAELAMLAEAEQAERFAAPGRVDPFEAIEHEFQGEFGVRADPAFGIVYGERPEVLDDLTRIGGVTGLVSEKLHENGVYRFKQVANWSDGNVATFARVLGVPKEQIEGQKWVPQARRLHRQIYQPGKAWTVDRPAVEEYEQRIRERFARERVKADPDCGILYVGRPGHVDDLTDVEGVDAAMVRKLHGLGIYCFRQMENWAASSVRALAERLEISPERIYRERWIQQAEEFPCQLPKPKAEALPEQERSGKAPAAALEDESGMRRDERFGLVFRQRPAKVDHLRSIKGVGPKIERRLNELGVYRFRQIANWNERQVRAFAERLHLWERMERERWVEQARELAELSEAEAQEIFLAPERVDQMAILDSEFGHEPSVRVDPYLGIVFDEPPTVVDDLSLIDGIGRRLEEELNHLGVFRYNQIAAWSGLNVAHFARHLYCEQERIERDKWIPQAKRLYRETYSASWAWGVSHPSLAEYQARIEEEFATEAVRADETLGVIYTGWPSHVDDLTCIQGITREIERAMNRLGVFTFEQIANWAEGTVEEMAIRLGIPQQKIYRDRWIAQAAELAGQVSPSPQVAAGNPDPHLLNVLAAEPGIEVDEQFGLLYAEMPRPCDPLTAIRGIGFGMERQLNKLGIYRHRQIACWAERNVKAVSERLRLGGRIEREQWVMQAKQLTAMAESESGRLFVAPAYVDQEAILVADFEEESALRVDPRLGILYEVPPDVKDDLTQISGVGPRLEEELNELGVFRFKQIGAWSDGNVGEFAQRLFCYKDRIERDKWVPQARRLHRDIYRASPEWGIPRPSVSDYEERIELDFPGSGLQADREYGLIYPEEPEWPDSLVRVQGISPRIEEDLRIAGVYTYGQIACWSEANVEAFSSRLRIARERIYRDRWIPQACAFWEEQRQRGGTGFAHSRPVSADPVREPRNLARSPRPRGLTGGDLRRPERRDPPLAGRPLREREERAREGEERDVLAREDWEKEDRELRKREEEEARRREQETRRREERERAEERRRLREERERVEEERRLREERERVEEERRLREERERVEEELRLREERERVAEERRLREERERGLRDRKEREALERAEQIRRERLERSRESGPVRVPAQAAPVVRERRGERGVAEDPELEYDERLGEVYRIRPERVDDLTLIRGVGPKIERQLRDCGVYRFSQIASWTRRQVDEYSRLLDIRDRISRENWVEQAWELSRLADEESAETYSAPEEVDGTSVLEQEFAGEWGVGVDDDLGILYEERPEVVDDLKLIRGLPSKLERELNAYGVYRFKQIASWSDHNVSEFARRLDCPKERIEQDRWIPQAKRLHRELYSASTEWGAYRPGIADYRAKIEEEFSGEDVVADAEYGIVYQSKPPVSDDLSLLRGLTIEAEQSLHEAGVFRFKQVANWSEANVAAFAELLGCSSERIYRDRWIGQARNLADSVGEQRPEDCLDQETYWKTHFTGEDAALDEQLGILYRRPPAEVDDLKRIRGIGRKIEQTLNEFGVYQYRQIALWTRDNAEEFASRVNAFRDRIFRDNWMRQARLLHEEKTGESLGAI